MLLHFEVRLPEFAVARHKNYLRVSIAASDLLMRWDLMSSELFTFTFHCNPSSTTLPAP